MRDEHQNKRRADRFYHEVLVAFRSPKREFITAQALDFSRVGVFINTMAELPIGMELEMLISIPGVSAPFEIKGRVARWMDRESAASSGGAPGVGVEFLNVSPEDADRIEHTVKMLKEALPGINE